MHGSNVIAFTKVSLPYGWLGNMSQHHIEYEGKVYKSAEALFQALRFSSSQIRDMIRAERSPFAAKLKAKANGMLMTVQPMSEDDVQNMEMVVRLKVRQHPQLATDLVDTGDAVIIEDVTSRPHGNNSFWGMALRGEEWVGQNVLGKIWMKIRSELGAKTDAS